MCKINSCFSQDDDLIRRCAVASYWRTTMWETASYGQITVKLFIEEGQYTVYGDCDLRNFETDESKPTHPGVTGVKTAFNVSLFH